MAEQIKLTVSTGWANGNHVEYLELPSHWENLNELEKEEYLNECATEYLHECCESFGEVVDED